MDAFWGITLSVLAISWFLKREKIKSEDRKPPVDKSADKARKEIERQRNREIEELRRKGYDEELIAVILPTIHNGQ